MASSSKYGTESVTFYIGHHESRRAYEVTGEVFHHAQDENYDMLTAPITNDAFHSRVLSILSNHLTSSMDQDATSSETAEDDDLPPPPIIPRLAPSDTALVPNDSVSQLIYLTSPWIDLCSSDPLIADISCQVLALEVAYASFCGASNVMISGPSPQSQGHESDGLTRYARAIQDALSAGIYIQVHIHLPMTGSSAIESSDDMGNLANFARPQFKEHLEKEQVDDEDDLASWDTWNLVRSNCKYNARLSIALTLPKEAPSADVQRRWFSEPLRILEIPGPSFHKTSKGSVTLSQRQRLLLSLYMRLRNPPWLLLSDVGPLPGLDEDENDPLTTTDSFDPTEDIWEISPTPAEASRQPQGFTFQPKSSPHLHYLRDLQSQQPPKAPIERFGVGYQDYLQSPLQPLTDNLESITYEVFEKDPVKYTWYERAITAALRDWSSQSKAPSGPNGGVVVAVVGAGRGPLVTRALRAAEAAGVKIEMWAVEKNPNAFVLLQRHNMTIWNDRVHLVHSDMRSWQGPSYSTASATATSPSNDLFSATTDLSSTKPAKIDILVSELLGSFADNELSPECLDGVQHLLNPVHGISIPHSYTAHATPISAPKLHADISARTAQGVADAAQIPYVVMLHSIDYLSASSNTGGIDAPQPIVKQAWQFTHPLPPAYLARPPGGSATATGNEHNRRTARLEFPCSRRGVCHGIAGYFETVLYSPSSSTHQNGGKGEETAPIELSTNPLTMPHKSRDMISWFPIFFPLKTPLYIPDSSVLIAHFWRQTDGRRVWYEWQMECFLQVDGGKRVKVGASELHSSVGSACLM